MARAGRAVPGALGRHPGTVVIATSLDEVDATVTRLIQIDVLVGLAVLAGLALVGVSMVRTALRPLGEIEVTAAAIGRGDLGRRVPDHHPGTEMGRLEPGAQRHARAGRTGLPGPGPLRGPGPRLRAAHAAVHRRRQPRAAHAAHVDPGLRRAAPAGCGDRSRGGLRPPDPDRGRGRAHGTARRRPAAPGPARPAAADGEGAGRRGRGGAPGRRGGRGPRPPIAG